MTDLTKLKELAERATSGRNFDRLPSAGGGLKYTCIGDDDSLVLRVDHKNGKFGFIGPKGDEDEAFFFACTPKAVLELIAEVERLRKVEALQKQVNEHYKTWYRECIDEPFDTWLKDDATHWIGEQDAAFQAWQYLHENKIWLMKERIEEHEQERDRLKAENEALRKIISECATACGAGCAPECTLEFMAMLPDEIASVVGKRAKNAAIGAVVWQFIDRMTDICEQDTAERILEQFVAAVRPAIDAALEGGGR